MKWVEAFKTVFHLFFNKENLLLTAVIVTPIAFLYGIYIWRQVKKEKLESR